jgi:hypothetical protein
MLIGVTPTNLRIVRRLRETEGDGLAGSRVHGLVAGGSFRGYGAVEQSKHCTTLDRGWSYSHGVAFEVRHEVQYPAPRHRKPGTKRGQHWPFEANFGTIRSQRASVRSIEPRRTSNTRPLQPQRRCQAPYSTQNPVPARACGFKSHLR